MRTYSRDTYLRATAAWTDFGPGWAEARRVSWERGFPMPPEGSRWDDRDADQPSQRSIVWRALAERSTSTLEIIRTSSSWHQVVARIVAEETWLREDAVHLEQDASAEREERPAYREAVMSIAAIVGRIADSRP